MAVKTLEETTSVNVQGGQLHNIDTNVQFPRGIMGQVSFSEISSPFLANVGQHFAHFQMLQYLPIWHVFESHQQVSQPSALLPEPLTWW